MADWIIHHEGAFNIWSTIADAPRFVSAITREQLTEIVRKEFGSDGLEKLPYRLARVLSTGCSSAFGATLDDCIAVNRAGPEEARLLRDEFIAQYLTLPPGVEGRTT